MQQNAGQLEAKGTISNQKPISAYCGAKKIIKEKATYLKWTKKNAKEVFTR